MSLKEMEMASGIDRSVWRNIESGKQRIHEDHIKAMCKIAPQYIYWLITGELLPETNHGQTRPTETAEEFEELLRNGTDG